MDWSNDKTPGAKLRIGKSCPSERLPLAGAGDKGQGLGPGLEVGLELGQILRAGGWGCSEKIQAAGGRQGFGSYPA